MKRILYLFLIVQSSFVISQVSFNEIDMLNGHTYNLESFRDLGDINNDGYPEIFISTDNYFTPNYDFYYLLNVNGDLKYSPRIHMGSTSNIYMGFLLDIDNDGLIDIVGQNGSGLQYYWLKNLGNNNFSNRQFLISRNHDYFSSDLFYDYNNDGFPDYFIATNQGKVFRYTNLQGNGFSTSELVFSRNESIGKIHFFDFNQDGKDDLLVHSFYNNFNLYLNDGSDYFSYHIPIETQANENYIDSFDFDNNTLNDFIIYDENSLKIRTFFYDEEEQEYYSEDILIDTPFTHISYGGSVISKLVDFNQDGLKDIFITTGPNEHFYSNLYYYENLGNQQFAEKVLIKEDIQGQYDLIFNDLNSDNELDILIVRNNIYANNKLILALYNQSNLNFHEEIIEQNLKTSNKTFLFDVNNDGNIDILNGKRNLTWYENRGENDWSGRRFFTSLNSDFARNHNYELIDINNDGLFDVISNETDDDISVDLEGNFFSIFKNLGNSNFEKIYSLEYEYLDHWEKYNIFNSNTNEYPDIYFVKTSWSDQSDSLFIIKNNNGVFDQPSILNILPDGTRFKPSHSDFELADLNNDGLPEIIYYDYSHTDNTYRLNYLQNLGENTFDKKIITTSIFMGAQKIHVLDYDSDGDLDIFLSDGMYEKPFRVYENENMVFSEITIDNHLIVENLLLHDINNDGLLDILTIGYYGFNHPEYEYLNTIFYFENQGNGEYEKILVNQFESHYSTEVFEKGNIYLYDKNLDGKLDILVSCEDAANTILFYLNTSNLEVQDVDNNKNQTQVFPNPFSEYINWKSIKQKSSYRVEVFDLTGKMIYQKEIKESYLNLNFLSKGVYILKIDNESFKIIKK